MSATGTPRRVTATSWLQSALQSAHTRTAARALHNNDATRLSRGTADGGAVERVARTRARPSMADEFVALFQEVSGARALPQAASRHSLSEHARSHSHGSLERAPSKALVGPPDMESFAQRVAAREGTLRATLLDRSRSRLSLDNAGGDAPRQARSVTAVRSGELVLTPAERRLQSMRELAEQRSVADQRRQSSTKLRQQASIATRSLNENLECTVTADLEDMRAQRSAVESLYRKHEESLRRRAGQRQQREADHLRELFQATPSPAQHVHVETGMARKKRASPPKDTLSLVQESLVETRMELSQRARHMLEQQSCGRPYNILSPASAASFVLPVAERVNKRELHPSIQIDPSRQFR